LDSLISGKHHLPNNHLPKCVKTLEKPLEAFIGYASVLTVGVSLAGTHFTAQLTPTK
jgi:hypothetical protein